MVHHRFTRAHGGRLLGKHHNQIRKLYGAQGSDTDFFSAKMLCPNLNMLCNIRYIEMHVAIGNAGAIGSCQLRMSDLAAQSKQ